MRSGATAHSECSTAAPYSRAGAGTHLQYGLAISIRAAGAGRKALLLRLQQGGTKTARPWSAPSSLESDLLQKDGHAVDMHRLDPRPKTQGTSGQASLQHMPRIALVVSASCEVPQHTSRGRRPPMAWLTL